MIIIILLYEVFCETLVFLVSVAAEDTEQIEEEVDKVEIQSERTKKGQFLCPFAHVGLHQEHLLDFL